MCGFDFRVCNDVSQIILESIWERGLTFHSQTEVSSSDQWYQGSPDKVQSLKPFQYPLSYSTREWRDNGALTRSFIPRDENCSSGRMCQGRVSRGSIIPTCNHLASERSVFQELQPSVTFFTEICGSGGIMMFFAVTPGELKWALDINKNRKGLGNGEITYHQAQLDTQTLLDTINDGIEFILLRAGEFNNLKLSRHMFSGLLHKPSLARSNSPDVNTLHSGP